MLPLHDEMGNLGCVAISVCALPLGVSLHNMPQDIISCIAAVP